VAIQEQEIDDPVIASGNGDAGLVHYGDASHDKHAGELVFQRRRVIRGQQFRCSAQVEDCRLELSRPLLDQRDVGGQEQR
jgi:hypothetical protein